VTRTRWAALAAVLALLAGLFLVTAPAQADTQEAAEDAHLLKKNGSGANEAALAIRGPGSNETWAIVKFTNVPAGPATLTITPTLIRTGNFLLVATTCGWSEATVTWANKPAPGAVLDTKPQALPTVTFNVGTLAAGDVCFYIQSSNGQAQASQVSSSEHATNPGPTLNTSSPPTTTTVAPTTTTQPEPTTTTTPPTTTTLPPPDCVLMSAHATPQAAVNATPTGGCLTIDGTFSVGNSPLNLARAMTVQCLNPAHGLMSTGTTWELVHLAGVSDLSLQGCTLESTGPTLAAAGGIGSSGTLARVRLVDLTIRNVEYGIAGSSSIAGTGWTDETFGLRVLSSTIGPTYATGIGWYPNGNPPTNTTRYVELGGNTLTGYQQSDQAGQAGIQTGGIPVGSGHNLHSLWNIHHNDLTAGCPSTQVNIGLDQLDSSEVAHNVVYHGLCDGEGIVVVGPNNWIHHNQVYDKGQSGGAFVLISYSSPPQQNRNNTFEDNLADGIPGSPTNQGLALSWGAGGLPIDNLIVRRFTAVEHVLGVQAYPYEGNPAGTVRIEDSNPGGAGPNPWCGGLGLGTLTTTVVNTPNCPAG
jgi:hypothetical protein